MMATECALGHDDSTASLNAESATLLALERLEIAASALQGLIYDFDLRSGRVWRRGRLVEALVLDAEATGDDWLALVHPEDVGGITETWAELKNDPAVERMSFDYRVRRPDGSYCSVRDSQVLKRDEAGTIVRILGTTIDLSDRDAQAEEVAELNRELAEALQFSERFIAILAHDLRNPLSAILTGSELLKRQVAEPAQRTVARITASAGRAARLVDQLLDVARSRARGGLAIERQPLLLNDVIAEVVEELRVVHPQREIHCELVPMVRGEGDAARLSQVVSNLLDNALQYGTPTEPVRVRLSDSELDISLCVTSFGPTIAPEQQSVLFDPYRRGTDGRGEKRGLGLGLFITKQIVAAHEGTVEVESTHLGGTTFTVRLPAHASGGSWSAESRNLDSA